MGRNYFSKAGGPYFINDGFSKHSHDHKPEDEHEDIKQDNMLAIYLSLGFVILLGFIGMLLVSAS